MHIYDLITQRILDHLAHGTVPWHRPWHAGGLPKNLLTQKPYRGVNVWLLAAQPYTSPYWLTFLQAQELGGRVRRGEKGTPVIFWKLRQEMREEETGEGIRGKHCAPVLRAYTVFNTDQCELPASLTARLAMPQAQALDPIQACDHVVEHMPQRPAIVHEEPRAYYAPGRDWVNLPAPHLFDHAADYYATLFHELTHSTGHASRLARPTVVNRCPFGSAAYSQEELVAEMGAAFLCGHCGIENTILDNSAAYIQSWLTVLRHESRLLIHAAAQAQQAVDFILGTRDAHKQCAADSEDIIPRLDSEKGGE